MELKKIIAPELAHNVSGIPVVGIDIGSRTGKAVLLNGGQLYAGQIPTGFDMQETASELLEEILSSSHLKREEVRYIVGTGYGRVALKFDGTPNDAVTEIACHAMGAHYLNPEVRTILDIGGQDSKAIRVNPASGQVDEFVMNDKCAAGTGRFLEKVARLLDLTIDELGEKSLQSENPVQISSQCVVFAESEVISLRAKGYKIEDIAAGIHRAAAARVKTLLKRVGIVPGLFFSGGVSNNVGMRKAIEEEAECPALRVPLDSIYTGALGAAVFADERAKGKNVIVLSTARQNGSPVRNELEELRRAEKQRFEAMIEDRSRKKAGYLCSYTPLEILTAAGVDNIRLLNAGNSETVASGEQITQSVFCDFTKGILGKFKLGDPLFQSLDRIYTFYTCDCIKKVGEAIDQFFKPSAVYILPRLKNKESSQNFYKLQILDFKRDVEQLTGEPVSEEKLRETIRLYNRVRDFLRRISELRKRPDAVLTGTQFLDLVNGYYYLPADRLEPIYRNVCEKLSAAPDTGERPIRIMMSGGIVAENDRKIIRIIEEDLHARVVVEDHCTGLKVAETRIEETGDPYQALAQGYIQQSPCARMKPLRERVSLSADLAEEYRADGVLYTYLKFCPCYGMTKHQFIEEFSKRGIPALELPVDYSTSDEGQLKTRIEAFIEVLRERRRTSRPDGAADRVRQAF